MLSEACSPGIFNSDRISTGGYGTEEARLRRFLSQWYVSMGFLAIMNGPVAEIEMESAMVMSKLEGHHVINDFRGFSCNLIPVFCSDSSLK